MTTNSAALAARVSLCRSYLESGRPVQGIDDIATSLLQPDNQPAVRAMGSAVQAILAAGRHDWDVAIADVEDAVVWATAAYTSGDLGMFSDTLTWLRLMRADLLMRGGRIKEVRSMIKGLWLLVPQDVELTAYKFLIRGRLCLYDGDIARAAVHIGGSGVRVHFNPDSRMWRIVLAHHVFTAYLTNAMEEANEALGRLLECNTTRLPQLPVERLQDLWSLRLGTPLDYVPEAERDLQDMLLALF